MKIHTVLTPANIEIEYRLAGAGSRLAAFVVDFTLQIIMCIIMAVVILFGIYGYRFDTLANIAGFALGLLIISWFVIYFCYFIICEMALNGQSIGKKIFGLRVIRDNGQPIGLTQSLVRGLFRSVLDIIYVGIFFILFSNKNKRVGDMAAGTVVVAEHYDNTTMTLRADHMPSASSKNELFIEQLKHLTLSQEEVNLLHSYMARKINLPDNGEHLKNEWAYYLSRKWGVEPDLIDDGVLSGILRINEARY